MRLPCPALAALLALPCAAPGAQAPRVVATIPIRVDPVAYVDVTINGQRATLVLDTGAPRISLDTSLVRLADVRITRRFDGERHVGEGRADSIRIGDVLLRDEAVSVRSFAAVNAVNPNRPPVLGVVGSTFFRRFVARFDFAEGRLTLLDAKSFAYEGTGSIVRVSFVDDKPVVRTTLALEGRPAVEARLLVDARTARAAITLTPTFARAAGIATDESRHIEVLGGVSLYGTGMDRIVRIPGATVGPVPIAQPVVTVSAAVGAALAGRPMDGTIGMGLLSRTTMILDYARSRIILEPGAEWGTPIDYPNVSGLQLQPRDGAVHVRWVIAGSPADSAGVRVDDVLVAVDDTAITAAATLPLPQLREAGTTHRLTLRRGGESQVVTITLRRLI